MIPLGVLKPLILISVVFWLRSQDFTDSDSILKARLFFAAFTGFTWILLAFIAYKIKSADDKTKLQVKESDLVTANKFGGAEPANENKYISTTVGYYDWIKYRATVASFISGPVIGYLVHSYWGFIQPLFIQSLMNLINLLTCELGQIHLLGKVVKRPFTEAPSLMKSLTQMNQPPQTASKEKSKKNK